MDEQKSSEQILGLTLQLHKYSVGNMNQKRNAEMLIWGHYDSLQINPITKWLDYSPKLDMELESRKDQFRNLANFYPVKLIFPSVEEADYLPPMCYADWKEFNALLEEKPCMSIVLLNVTNSFKSETEVNSLLDKFLRMIKTHCNSEKLKRAYFCVIPTLGYSDFCILMAGKSWGDALELTETLHSMTDANNTPVVSTDYFMPVLHGACREKRFEENFFEDCELSVRVNLRPGITLKFLRNAIPSGVSVFRPSGGSDYIFQASNKKEQTELLDFLFAFGAENVVIDINSTLRHEINAVSTESTRSDKVTFSEQETFRVMLYPTETPEFVSNFKRAISTYRIKILEKNRPRRQINSLYELANNIENICQQPHTGELVPILRDLLNNFSDCLVRCANNMDLHNWPFDEVEREVSRLCDIIDSFIADLSRADCFFIERERYNHASISSATSLLLAYNRWLNGFTRDVRKVTMQAEDSNYAFLVTSGGQDRTQTYNAFCELISPPADDPDDTIEKLPLITQMSERSLFDFSGTILRAFHECMHFCGIRLRKERIIYVAQFLSSLLAEKIGKALFIKESELAYAQYVARMVCSEDKVEQCVSEMEGIFDLQQNQLIRKIANVFWEYIEIGLETEPPVSYLSQDVQEWLYIRLLEALSGHVISPRDNSSAMLTSSYFAKKVHDYACDTYIEFNDRCHNLVSQYGADTAVFSFERNKYDLYRRKGEDGEGYDEDPVLHTVIQIICSRLLINRKSEHVKRGLVGKEDLHQVCKIPYINLTNNNAPLLLQAVTDIFSEAFADVIACKILDVDVEDYVLMHIYEDWDLSLSLDNEMAFSYRIPAVFHLCFPNALTNDGLSLTEGAKNAIQMAIDFLQAHGLEEGKQEAPKIINRIESLLERFNKKQGTASFLLEYLEGCISAYERRNVFEKLKRYSDTYKKLRLHKVNPEAANKNQKLLEMYYALINWKGAVIADDNN